MFSIYCGTQSQRRLYIQELADVLSLLLGVQKREVICTNTGGEEVAEDLCNPTNKPADTQDCNTEPCEAR